MIMNRPVSVHWQHRGVIRTTTRPTENLSILIRGADISQLPFPGYTGGNFPYPSMRVHVTKTKSPSHYNLLLLPDRTRTWRGDVDSHGRLRERAQKCTTKRGGVVLPRTCLGSVDLRLITSPFTRNAYTHPLLLAAADYPRARRYNHLNGQPFVSQRKWNQSTAACPKDYRGKNPRGRSDPFPNGLFPT